MIIILEGPDGGGKTTLAQMLSRQTGYPIVHMSKPETEEEKLSMMQDYMQMVKTSRNIILDRCWYSEMVYGKIMRDKSYIDYPQMYALEAELAKHGAVIIYCTGTPTSLWKRCTGRGENYITTQDKFMAICHEYDLIMTCPHKVPVVRYEV